MGAATRRGGAPPGVPAGGSPPDLAGGAGGTTLHGSRDGDPRAVADPRGRGWARRRRPRRSRCRRRGARGSVPARRGRLVHRRDCRGADRPGPRGGGRRTGDAGGGVGSAVLLPVGASPRGPDRPAVRGIRASAVLRVLGGARQRAQARARVSRRRGADLPCRLDDPDRQGRRHGRCRPRWVRSPGTGGQDPDRRWHAERRSRTCSAAPRSWPGCRWISRWSRSGSSAAAPGRCRPGPGHR